MGTAVNDWREFVWMIVANIILSIVFALAFLIAVIIHAKDLTMRSLRRLVGVE